MTFSELCQRAWLEHHMMADAPKVWPLHERVWLEVHRAFRIMTLEVLEA
ncbi:hypothetical protein [Phenylobacterium sp.]